MGWIGLTWMPWRVPCAWNTDGLSGFLKGSVFDAPGWDRLRLKDSSSRIWRTYVLLLRAPIIQHINEGTEETWTEGNNTNVSREQFFKTSLLGRVSQHEDMWKKTASLQRNKYSIGRIILFITKGVNERLKTERKKRRESLFLHRTGKLQYS